MFIDYTPNSLHWTFKSGEFLTTSGAPKLNNGRISSFTGRPRNCFREFLTISVWWFQFYVVSSYPRKWDDAPNFHMFLINQPTTFFDKSTNTLAMHQTRETYDRIAPSSCFFGAQSLAPTMQSSCDPAWATPRLGCCGGRSMGMGWNLWIYHMTGGIRRHSSTND